MKHLSSGWKQSSNNSETILNHISDIPGLTENEKTGVFFRKQDVLCMVCMAVSFQSAGMLVYDVGILCRRGI